MELTRCQLFKHFTSPIYYSFAFVSERRQTNAVSLTSSAFSCTIDTEKGQRSFAIAKMSDIASSRWRMTAGLSVSIPSFARRPCDVFDVAVDSHIDAIDGDVEDVAWRSNINAIDGDIEDVAWRSHIDAIVGDVKDVA